MSIRINYKGNVGNCLFQYVYTRILSERNGFHFLTPFPYQKILQTTAHKTGENHISPKIVFEEPFINEKDGGPDLDDLEKRYDFYRQFDKKLAPCQYILNGYFECSELFNPYETLIKSYFKIDDFKKNTNDIVMNIRLGDFADLGRIITSDWYINILENEKFDKLYIVGGKADEPYLKAFKKYNPIIVPSSPVNDFHFIKNFDKIICSNSTFCWWAAFLSEANTIYVSDKWISPLLTTCKNSINIKADYLKSYTTFFYYSPVQQLINFKDKLKLELDNYVQPTKNEIKQVVIDCIKIIYNHIKSISNVEPFTIQLDIKDICRFSINFYKGGSWLSEGSYPLADCGVYFADWKSFYNWIFWGLREVTDPYINIEGNINSIVSLFDLTIHQDRLTSIFNNFKKKASFITYTEIDNIVEAVIFLLENETAITWFDERKGSFGKLYILFKKIDITGMVNIGSYETNNKFFRLEEVPLDKQSNDARYQNIGLLKDENIINRIHNKLSLKNIRIVPFNITLKQITIPLISIEDAIRMFEMTSANYLVFDNYIVKKT